MRDEKAETRELVRQEILAYKGDPFIIGEFARHIGAEWGVVARVVKKLVEEGKLTEIRKGNTRFYQVSIDVDATPFESAEQSLSYSA